MYCCLCLQSMSISRLSIVSFLLLMSLTYCHKASAQLEMWDAYISRVDNKPVSIMLDMALILKAPDSRYPYLVITGPQAANHSKTGIPTHEETEELEKILDATDNFLTGVTAKVLAGTVTYNNQRNNYYYVRDTAGVRNAILRMYNRNYKNYKFSVIIKPDKEWLTYRTYLYPDDSTQNWMDNNRNITAMLQQGDSLTQERNIVFAACFPSDTARSAFTSFVTGIGYTIDKTPLAKNGENTYCLLFSKKDRIKVDSFNNTTMYIRSQVKKYNGSYGGWNAPVR